MKTRPLVGCRTLEQLQKHAAASKSKPPDTTILDVNNESDDICVVHEALVSEDTSLQASDKSGGADATPEKAAVKKKETEKLAKLVPAVATKATPRRSKPSLNSFERLTNVRVQASGTACKQYLVSANAASSSAQPLLCASVRVHAASERCCGGGGKAKGRHGNQPFTVDVLEYASRAPVVRILCDQHGRATVESPPSEVIGYITAERVVCSLWFTIRDLHGAAMLVVRGNRYCHRQSFVSFRILLPDESAEVAKLQRTDVSYGAAPASAAYTVEMPEAVGADVKAMLIGVAMLFDRNLFSQN